MYVQSEAPLALIWLHLKIVAALVHGLLVLWGARLTGHSEDGLTQDPEAEPRFQGNLQY